MIIVSNVHTLMTKKIELDTRFGIFFSEKNYFINYPKAPEIGIFGQFVNIKKLSQIID